MLQEPPDPIYILRGCNSPVTSLHFTTNINSHPDHTLQTEPSSSTLLAGTEDGKLHLWDLKSWRRVNEAEAHGSSILSIQTHPSKPETVLTQGRDGWIHAWDVAGSGLTKKDSLKTPNPAFCPTAYLTLPEGTSSVAATPTENQSQVDLLSLENKTKVLSLCPKAGDKAYGMCMCIRSVSSTTEPSFLLVGYEDGSISTWDLRMTSNELSHMKLHNETLMSFDYHPVINKGVSASVDQKLTAWSFSDTKEFTKVRNFEISNPGVGCVRFRPDGKLLVTGGWDGRVRAFGGKKQSPLVVLEHHKESVQCAEFSPEGLLAVGSKDKHISVWSIYR